MKPLDQFGLFGLQTDAPTEDAWGPVSKLPVHTQRWRAGTKINIRVSFTIWEWQRNPRWAEEKWRGSRPVRRRARIHTPGTHTSRRNLTGNDPMTWRTTLSADLFDGPFCRHGRRWEESPKKPPDSRDQYVSVREFLWPNPGTSGVGTRAIRLQVAPRGVERLAGNRSSLREGWKILSSHSPILRKWMRGASTKLWSWMAFEDLVACVNYDVSQLVSCWTDFLSIVVLFPLG